MMLNSSINYRRYINVVCTTKCYRLRLLIFDEYIVFLSLSVKIKTELLLIFFKILKLHLGNTWRTLPSRVPLAASSNCCILKEERIILLLLLTTSKSKYSVIEKEENYVHLKSWADVRHDKSSRYTYTIWICLK